MSLVLNPINITSTIVWQPMSFLSSRRGRILSTESGFSLFFFSFLFATLSHSPISSFARRHTPLPIPAYFYFLSLFFFPFFYSYTSLTLFFSPLFSKHIYTHLLSPFVIFILPIFLNSIR